MVKERIFVVRDRHSEEGHVKMEAEIRVMLPKPRNTRSHQKRQEAR